MSWKRSLLNRDAMLRRILNQNSSLRHDQKVIGPSTIGNQYYCEQQIELKHTVGEIETVAKKMGEEVHTAQLQAAEKVSLKEAVEIIEKEEVCCIQECTLIAEVADMPLVGRPDCIFFTDGQPRIVAELKNTHSYPRIYNDFLVQARMYGLLLDANGFNTAHCNLLIAVQKFEAKEKYPPGGYFFHDIDAIYDTLKHQQPLMTKWRKAALYLRKLYSFDKEQALRELKWARQYWLNERKPIPTKNKKKCKACPYTECEEKQEQG